MRAAWPLCGVFFVQVKIEDTGQVYLFCECAVQNVGIDTQILITYILLRIVIMAINPII